MGYPGWNALLTIIDRCAVKSSTAEYVIERMPARGYIPGEYMVAYDIRRGERPVANLTFAWQNDNKIHAFTDGRIDPPLRSLDDDESPESWATEVMDKVIRNLINPLG
jgi:hypothetical protein